MKKFGLFLSVLMVIALVLAGCGNEASTDNAAQVDDDQTTESNDATESSDDSTVEDTTEVDGKDIFLQALEKMNALKSYSADIKVDMEMDFGDGEEFSSEIFMKMNSTLDPMAAYIHQTIKMTDPFLSSAQITQEMEMYLTESSFYMFEPTANLWITFPDEFMNEISQVGDLSQSPAEELERLVPYIDDFTYEELDDVYRFSFSASSDNIMQLIKDSMPNELEDMSLDEMFEYMTINEFQTVMEIDKETLLVTYEFVKMDLVFDYDGERLEMKTISESNYHGFNEVDEIVVPEEVIQNAVDFDEFGDLDDLFDE